MAGMAHIQDSITLILYMKMNNSVLNTIEQYNMISKGDAVAVCLSGGADSMALLHLMCRYKEFFEIDLFAVHINHGLRKASDDEEVFVKKYCEKLGIKCLVYHFDMNEKQKPQGMSIETWARQLRYEVFEKVSAQHKAKLATAHTLSDKCETVIFNLCRGTSVKGVCGIPAVRENIIRPLINCTRQDIENYCKENNVPFVTDETNFSEEYSRNKIRLKVVPVLKQVNSKSEQLIGEFTQEMEQIYTFLTQLSDTLYRNSVSLNGFDVTTILKHDDVVIKFFLRKILEKHNCLSKENINAVLEGLKSGSFIRQLTGDITCRVKDGYLTFYTPKPHSEKFCAETAEITADEETVFLSESYILRHIYSTETEKLKKIDKNYLNNCIDCDKIKGKLFLRTRRTGDAFTLPKRKVTKTVKKLFMEDKIPQIKRDKTAILADEEGNVVWIDGYGVNSRFAADAESRNIAVLEKL